METSMLPNLENPNLDSDPLVEGTPDLRLAVGPKPDSKDETFLCSSKITGSGDSYGASALARKFIFFLRKNLRALLEMKEILKESEHRWRKRV